MDRINLYFFFLFLFVQVLRNLHDSVYYTYIVLADAIYNSAGCLPAVGFDFFCKTSDVQFLVFFCDLGTFILL